MYSADDWKIRSNLVIHIAEQLIQGRLGLFLGAGVSAFYGLPLWWDLVNDLNDINDLPPLKDNDDLGLRMTRLKGKYANDNAFITAVKNALYKDKSIDFESIRGNLLLSSIGALLMASTRGSASTVFSLNYDDLLEIYLEYHGFVTESIWRECHWSSNTDVSVFHPHGFLPLTAGRSGSEKIVIGAPDYDRIMKPQSVWRNTLISSLRCNTFIYIGLSGDDPNLRSLISEVSESHAIKHERIRYHGLRFAKDTSDDLTYFLETQGVFTQQIDNYEEVPELLFEICQKAREIREKQMAR